MIKHQPIIQELQNLHLLRCTANYDANLNKEVVKLLAVELAKNPIGNKLACNQIGILNHRVAIVNVIQPMFLINPRILKSSIPIIGISDDLSFPQKIIRTYKYANITVASDNFKDTVTFGMTSEDEELSVTDPRMMLCFAMQHVIDLLNGITMFQREFTDDIQVKTSKHITITIINDSGDEKVIKQKYFINFKNKGWRVKEQ